MTHFYNVRYPRGVNYFKVLGLIESHQVTTKDVKEAYFSLVKKYHPDTALLVDEFSRQENIAKFHEISQAYTTLKNDASRSMYLRQLNPSLEAFNADIDSIGLDKDTSEERHLSQEEIEQAWEARFRHRFRRDKASESNEPPHPLRALLHPMVFFVYVPLLSCFISSPTNPKPGEGPAERLLFWKKNILFLQRE